MNFLDAIKTHFIQYDLFVIFIHSPRFYESHISLNEMGAAWALQQEYSSFLTKDMTFAQMDGVVTNQEIAVKVDSSEAKPRMNDWKDRVLAWLAKSQINATIWERNRDAFLQSVNAISYEVQQQQGKVQLTNTDEERLRTWVDSGDNSMFQVWYSGNTAVFGLGASNQYQVESGREMAEWQGFFKRLLALGLIEQIGYTQNGKHPEYRLTENAYKYFDN